MVAGVGTQAVGTVDNGVTQSLKQQQGLVNTQYL